MTYDRVVSYKRHSLTISRTVVWNAFDQSGNGPTKETQFLVGLFLVKLSSKTLVNNKEVFDMNSTTYMIVGVLCIIFGIVGIYYIREAPGLALFASIALIAGIAMVGKATGKL